MNRRNIRAEGFDITYQRRGTKRRIALSFPPELFDRLADEAHDRQVAFTSVALECITAGLKARVKTHCKRGHALDADNVRQHRRADGSLARVCKTCRRETERNAQKKRRKREI